MINGWYDTGRRLLVEEKEEAKRRKESYDPRDVHSGRGVWQWLALAAAVVSGCVMGPPYQYKAKADSGELVVGKTKDDETGIIVAVYRIDGMLTSGANKGNPVGTESLPIAPGKHTVTVFMGYREDMPGGPNPGYFDTICEGNVSVACEAKHRYHFVATFQHPGRFGVRLLDTTEGEGGGHDVARWLLNGSTVYYDR